MKPATVLLMILGAACARQASSPENTGKEAAAATSAPGAVAREAAGESAKVPVSPAEPVTLPEGTVLKIRTTSTLSTKTTSPGEQFEASLEEPLAHNGRVVAPKGARVVGRVVEADPGGRVKGRAEIAVRLTQLHVLEGKSVELQTSTFVRQARSTKKEDAMKIGIGSAAGAAIGAIAGGGAGAAIGAASGAGAGTGMVLATRGAPAVIPAESVLTFKLRVPVTINR
jgi:hypothetical protein